MIETQGFPGLLIPRIIEGFIEETVNVMGP
jgi:hypothetical protein